MLFIDIQMFPGVYSVPVSLSFALYSHKDKKRKVPRTCQLAHFPLPLHWFVLMFTTRGQKVSVSVLIKKEALCVEVGWTSTRGGKHDITDIRRPSNHLRVVRKHMPWRDNGTMLSSHWLKSTHICCGLCFYRVQPQTHRSGWPHYVSYKVT